MSSPRIVSSLALALLMVGALSEEAQATVAAGRLLWGGVPVTGPATAAMHISLSCPPPSIEAPYALVQADGTYSVEYSSTGTCDLSVRLGKRTGSNVSEVAHRFLIGMSEPLDIDLTGATGWVQGRVIGQGATDVNYGAPVDGDGRFEFLSVPGLLILRPVNASGDAVGPFNFTFPVVAGQTTDLGALTTGGPSDGWGDVTAETTWRGQPVFVPGLFVVRGRAVLAAASGPTSVGTFPVGPQEVAFWGDDIPRPCPGGCLNTKPKLGQVSVVVSGGQTSNAKVELGGSLGRLRGQLTVNDVPEQFDNPMPHGPSLRLRPGSVDLLLPAGTYSIGVEIPDPVAGGADPVLVAELTVSITAGQTTDLGSRDFQYVGSGYVSTTATWNGGPLYGDGIGADSVALTGPTFQTSFYDEGITLVQRLPLGTTQTLEVHSGGCGVHGDPSDRLGQTTITASAPNQVLPLALDLTSWAGRVVGTVEIDGLRPSEDWRPVTIGIDGADRCGWSPSVGIFNVLLTPGPHTITVSDSQNPFDIRPIAQLSVTAVAGTTTDLGLIALTTTPPDPTDAGVPEDPSPDGGMAGDGGTTGAPNPWDPPPCVPSAEMCNEIDDDCDGRINQGLSCTFEFTIVQGTATWKGAPMTGGDWGIAALGQSAEADTTSGRYLFRTKFVPGPLPLALNNGEGCIVSHQTANVVTSATETSVDFTNWVGHLVGSLTWDDRILRDPWRSSPCGNEIDPDTGKIGGYPRPGISTFGICDSGSEPSRCSDFSVMARAGEETHVAVDARTTALDGPSSLAFHGGVEKVGGLTVAFPPESASATFVTTSAATDVGPPPPPNLRVLRVEGKPRYWTLTATGSPPLKGPLRFCMRYDDRDVRGHESTLQVLEWSGGSARDITVSRDPTTNVVCGTPTRIHELPRDIAETPREPTFFAVAGDNLPGRDDPWGCSLPAGKSAATDGWGPFLAVGAALALFTRRKRRRR